MCWKRRKFLNFDPASSRGRRRLEGVGNVGGLRVEAGREVEAEAEVKIEGGEEERWRCEVGGSRGLVRSRLEGVRVEANG